MMITRLLLLVCCSGGGTATTAAAAAFFGRPADQSPRNEKCVTGKWTQAKRPPAHCTPYPNGLFQKKLPNAGKGGPIEHLALNSDKIAFNSLLMGEYPNGTQNPVYIDANHLAVTVSDDGWMSANNIPFYYGVESDPLYKVVNCREPGYDPAHNPVGTYWHIPENASYSGGASDM
jgi:hypothetical protein